jgi:hypothetical protein
MRIQADTEAFPAHENINGKNAGNKGDFAICAIRAD